MTDFDPTNRGAVFFEKEVKSDNHPTLTGKLNVEGKEYRIAMWDKTSRNGDQFFSIAISEPREQREANTDSGYEQAKAKAQEIKDRVHEVNEDEPIDLDSIPF
jgi:uncharacterized protein (DUF736 family)